VTGDTLGRALRLACSDLAALQIPFALVGGMAVSLRGYVRFTRDIDFALSVEGDREVEAAVRGARDRGYEVQAIVEQEAAGRIATVRLGSPLGVTVDLLTASSGIEREVVERSGNVVWDEALTVPVARAEELVALKILAMTDRRPRDRGDALALLQAGGLSLPELEANLRLIEARGYQRRQDLQRKLADLLATLAQP
jgi:hypothetical protein